jgi:tetratricopeptide (TPR) repeat protein
MSEKLQEAVSLYKKGDKSQAMKLLIEIVKQEPNNSVAWYGLALCLDDLDKKIYCLKKVLSLDPSHKKAQQVLENLQVSEKSPNHQKTTESQPLPVTKKKTSFSSQPVFVLGISVLVCVIIIGVALTGMNLYKPVPTSIPQTRTPTIIFYDKDAAIYLERVEDMHNEFQIDFSKDVHGNLITEDGTAQIATVVGRGYTKPNFPRNEISAIFLSIWVFDDVKEAKIHYQTEVQKFSSSSPLTGEFDNGAYEIGIDENHVIFIDKLIRKSNVVIQFYSYAILDDNVDSENLTIWSVYYQNFILSKIY